MIIPYTEHVRSAFIYVLCVHMYNVYIYISLYIIVADDVKCFNLFRDSLSFGNPVWQILFHYTAYDSARCV